MIFVGEGFSLDAFSARCDKGITAEAVSYEEQRNPGHTAKARAGNEMTSHSTAENLVGEGFSLDAFSARCDKGITAEAVSYDAATRAMVNEQISYTNLRICPFRRIASLPNIVE